MTGGSRGVCIPARPSKGYWQRVPMLSRVLLVVLVSSTLIDTTSPITTANVFVVSEHAAVDPLLVAVLQVIKVAEPFLYTVKVKVAEPLTLKVFTWSRVNVHAIGIAPPLYCGLLVVPEVVSPLGLR